MLTELLTENVSQNFIDFILQTLEATREPNWIGNIIGKLFAAVGIVAVGVIIFTLILKTIVLPIDLYSRINTKKQSLIMERMRPQMEKLQKQYANDKQMYSQKVMELQKKNGYSMFGACIPMIVSLVIFMVVFSAFSTYSQYANLTSYNNMVNAYNVSVNEYVLTNREGNTVNENGFLIEDTDPSTGKVAYRVNFDKFLLSEIAKTEYPEQPAPAEGETETVKKTYADVFNEQTFEKDKMVVVRRAVREIAQQAAANYYHTESSSKNGAFWKGNESFLWIGNVWYPDSMLNKAVPEFSKFMSAVSRVAPNADSSYEKYYNEVTAKLSVEKSNFNGYFVLIVLAIGLMFLQQFIMMKSQKAVGELGSVDGTGAKTNKWMTIMMPIIYGVFSFFYSAAFSIYMIINTAYGLITTVIVNAILNARFKKMEERGVLEEYLSRSARKRAERAKRRAERRKLK